MTKQVQRIARLMDRAVRSGPSGRMLVQYIEKVMVDYVRGRGGTRFETEDCPESDPNCDEPPKGGDG